MGQALSNARMEFLSDPVIEPKTKPSGTGDRPDRRSEILDVAARQFASIGYLETGMRDLARILGIKSASLYYHFPSKDALLLDLCRIGITELLSYLDNVMAQDMPLEERLLTLFQAHLSMLRHRGDYLVVYMRHRRHLPPEVAAPLLSLHRSYQERIDLCIERAQDQGLAKPQLSIPNVHVLLVAFMRQLNDLFLEQRDIELDILCRDTAHIIARGLST